MNKYFIKLCDTVEKLNTTSNDESSAWPLDPFELRTNGTQAIVQFMGQTVWNSEDNGYIGEEDMETMLFMRAGKVMRQLTKQFDVLVTGVKA